jgi:cyclopropane-fatty-acyl-phospholipid synthase
MPSEAANPNRNTSLPSAARHRVPFSARAVIGLLSRLRGGRITLSGPGGYERTFGDEVGIEGAAPVPHVHLVLADWDVVGICMRRGDIGFAETRMEGRWHADNPAALVELFCRNRAAMEKAIYGSFAGNVLYRIKHLLNSNTRDRARKNIEAHYDLGNDFYRLWLDSTMTYSSALFDAGHAGSLEAAQAAKYRRILQRLAPRPGDRVLEIGCGWGGFAEVATREFGVHVTGLTLSPEQLRFATARLERAGLAKRADLRLTDYRDMHGEFDHIASIEMFEAVGEGYWDSYFACVRRNLKPGGRAMVQSITIDESLFERYRKSTDFIQQYIFPGGMLPSPTEFGSRASRAGLTVADEFRFGRDYGETLKRWRVAFMARLPEVRQLGFDERFVRLWEFYLAYCEGAFNAGSTDVVQFELTRSDAT